MKRFMILLLMLTVIFAFAVFAPLGVQAGDGEPGFEEWPPTGLVPQYCSGVMVYDGPTTQVSLPYNSETRTAYCAELFFEDGMYALVYPHGTYMNCGEDDCEPVYWYGYAVDGLNHYENYVRVWRYNSNYPTMSYLRVYEIVGRPPPFWPGGGEDPPGPFPIYQSLEK